MKTHLNPETLPRHPAFSQAVVVTNPSATIYVGGQNGVTPDGEIVGDTLREQTLQAFSNLEAALAAADATIDDVVHWRIAVVAGQSIDEGFAAFTEKYGALTDPPAITVHFVAGLNPGFLVEIDAVAVR